jgi:hypothetical protein
MLPYPAFDFYPYASTFTGVANVLVIDLQRIDGLNKIRAFTMDMYQVTNVDHTIRQFDNPNVYPGIIVNDTADNSFSYADGHTDLPIFFEGKVSAPFLGSSVTNLKTQGICRAFKGGGL